MSQHDGDIANQLAALFRAEINTMILAVFSTHSGSTEPSTIYANQQWYDTTNNKLKIRNEANSAWITIGTLDQSNNQFIPSLNGLTLSVGGIYFSDGTDFAKLSIGTAGQVLQVNSGATAPEWATASLVNAYNAVGSYCLARDLTTSSHTRTAGSSVSGSLLSPASYNQNTYTTNSSGTPLKNSGTLAGTWRLMGYVLVDSAANDRSLSLYTRIS